MSQMRPFVAVAPGGAEVVIVAVLKAHGNGRKGFQSVNLFPLFFSVFILLFDFIFSYHAAKHRFVGFIVVIIIFHVLCQLFHGGFPGGKFRGKLFDKSRTVFSESTALFGSHIGQKLNPVKMYGLSVAFHIQIVSGAEGFIGDVEIHPFDIGAAGAGSHFDGVCLPAFSF